MSNFLQFLSNLPTQLMSSYYMCRPMCVLCSWCEQRDPLQLRGMTVNLKTGRLRGWQGNKVSLGILLENVAAIKQGVLLKYFTDRFTNFRPKKRKFGLFEMLFVGCNMHKKNNVSYVTMLLVRLKSRGCKRVSETFRPVKEETINGGSLDELWAWLMPLPLIFLDFSHKAPVLHLEQYIKNVCDSLATLVLCICLLLK